MKLGAVYPQVELGGDPASFRRIGLAVEELGYDHLLMYDHVVGASHHQRHPPLWGHYDENDPFHDPLVAFGYLAAITHRIELITGILILPQRQTVIVAKQATDVDLLSGGRLRLGVGTGWNYVEYDALGEDFHTRGKKLSEQITYLRRLWSESVIRYQGAFHRIDHANIIQRPRRRIPIWCGGFSEPAYRRAAKLADGFIFNLGLDAKELGAWTWVQEMLREEGRSCDEFGAHFTMQATAGETFGLREIGDMLPRLRDAGASDASIVTMDKGFTTADQHLDFLTEAKHRADTVLR